MKGMKFGGRKGKKGKLSRMKAGEILEHGEVGGKAITPRQRGFFGAVKSGAAEGGSRIERGLKALKRGAKF